jgi:hypothetical protein
MKISKLFLSVLLMLVFFNARADKLEKGFERLKMFDYFSAKEYFDKSIDNDPAAAAFGLSAIFSSEKNPFYNPDSAWKYIQYADSMYKFVKEKTKKEYDVLGVNEGSIRVQIGFICEDAFARAKKSDSVTVYNHYLDYYSSCAQHPEVISLRNAAAFNDARKINTSAAYRAFMTLFPQSLQYGQAVSKYEELLYAETTADKSIESYEKFIMEYPDNPYRNEAEKMIFALTVPEKSIEQYTAYVRRYKSGFYAEQSWREIYRLYMTDFSQETFNKFKEAYPDYPYKEELETDFRLQNYTFLPFREDNKWGYINELGEIMIKPSYDDVSLFSEGLAVVMKEGKYGYIDKAGKTIIELRFQDAELFKNGCAVIKQDTLYGLINKTGEILIPPAYDELSEASSEIYIAVKDNSSGYIHRNGDTLTGLIYDLANEFYNGYAIVNKDEKFGLLNAGGYFNIEPKFFELVFIGEGLLKALSENDFWGIVNVQGDTILPFQYEAIGEFSENRALAAKKGKCGYINEMGTVVIPLKFPFASILLTTGQFENGFALHKQKYKSTLIDTAGKIISFSGFEDYGKPSAGLFPVRKNKKWGFIDANKKIKVPIKYESVESFANGFAVVHQNKQAGLVDTSGKIFITPLYEGITVKENSILVRSNGKSGLLSREGILFVPCLYSKIEFITPTIVKATDAEGTTYINLENSKIIFNNKIK